MIFCITYFLSISFEFLYYICFVHFASLCYMFCFFIFCSLNESIYTHIVCDLFVLSLICLYIYIILSNINFISYQYIQYIDRLCGNFTAYTSACNCICFLLKPLKFWKQIEMWAKYKNRKLANLGVASESLRGSWALVTLVCLALSKVLFWNKQGTCERHAREDVAPNWVCFFGLNISEAAGGAGKNPGPSDVSCTDGKSYSWIVSNGFRCAYAKLCRCKKQQHKQPTNRDGSRGTRLEFVFILRLCTPSHIFPRLHKSSHTDILRLTPDSRAPAKNWADAVLVLAFVLGASSSSASFSSSSGSGCWHSVLVVLVPASVASASSASSCSGSWSCSRGLRLFVFVAFGDVFFGFLFCFFCFILSWACLGPILGLSWAHVRPMLANVGPILALCWPMVPYVGPILPHVGTILALSWPYVGPMLAYLGPMLALSWPQVGPSWGLCWR